MELSTVPYYSKCWFENHQVKAVLGVGAFLSLSIIIFCSYCSRARSHLCDVMKWGMERGKRKVSHLKCACQFILLFLLLQLGLEILHYRIPHWAKECMKTSQEPSGPLPHSTEHAPFQNTGWKIWGHRDWNKDTAWWEEWVRETCEWLASRWRESLSENMHFRERILPHLSRHNFGFGRQHTWVSHLEARNLNVMLALMQIRVCPVTLPLLIVLRRVYNRQEVPHHNFGRYICLCCDFTSKENCCIRQKLI